MAKQRKGPAGPIPSVDEGSSDNPEAPPTGSTKSRFDDPKLKAAGVVAAGATAIGFGADALLGDEKDPTTTSEDTIAQADESEDVAPAVVIGDSDGISTREATTASRAATGAVQPVVVATGTTTRPGDTTIINRETTIVDPPDSAAPGRPNRPPGGDPIEKILDDGTKVLEYPDGTVTTIRPDGGYTTVYPDGTAEVATPGTDSPPGSGDTERPGDLPVIRVDGAVERTNPDGSRTVEYPAGFEETGADGEYRYYPDGAVETFDTEGNRTVAYPDGGLREYHADGSITTTRPDGTVIVQHPDNSTTVTHPDGTVEELGPVHISSANSADETFAAGSDETSQAAGSGVAGQSSPQFGSTTPGTGRQVASGGTVARPLDPIVVSADPGSPGTTTPVTQEWSVVAPPGFDQPGPSVDGGRFNDDTADRVQKFIGEDKPDDAGFSDATFEDLRSRAGRRDTNDGEVSTGDATAEGPGDGSVNTGDATAEAGGATDSAEIAEGSGENKTDSEMDIDEGSSDSTLDDAADPEIAPDEVPQMYQPPEELGPRDPIFEKPDLEPEDHPVDAPSMQSEGDDTIDEIPGS